MSLVLIKRAAGPLRAFSSNPVAAPKKKKIVVLGSGWGGCSVINNVDTDLYELYLVSPRNHFLFTPLLTSTAVGTLEFRGVCEPVRMLNHPLNYIQGSCRGIDTSSKTIVVESYFDPSDDPDAAAVAPKPLLSVRYDELVVAVGGVPSTFGVPGVEKYCHFLRSLSDARGIRLRIVECFERACNPTLAWEERRRLLHFVVIGGGPTSVELAAELYDFVTQDCPRWYPQLGDDVQLTLIEAGKTLLSSFDQKLSEYTLKLFKKRHIQVLTGQQVVEVRSHELVLKDGSHVPYGLGVWSTGVAPCALVRSLEWPKGPGGRILVDEYLRVPGADSVYAIGDGAVQSEDPLPQTAQAANQEGSYLARMFNAKAKSDLADPVGPFSYKHQGMLAYVGGWKALFDSPHAKNSGFVSWIIWNSVYLTKLLSVRNRIMIPMYWFKSFWFGRDITFF